MILPLITGYVFGRIVRKKSIAIVIGLLLGTVLGLIATYTLIPVLYPIFAGDAGLVVIPEASAIGIMFLTSDFIIYFEIIYMPTRSFIIDLVFVVTGVFSAVVGTWFGSTYHTERKTTPFEEM